MNHFCYCLYNNENNKTYVGYTNNLTRRIRQHNGEITGGAKYTTAQHVTWQYLFYVTATPDLFDHKTALSFEWHIKHPVPPGPRGPLGRIKSLLSTINHSKFNHINHYDIYVHPNFVSHLDPANEKYTIHHFS